MPACLIVFAHVGAALRPHDLRRAWTFEPVTALLLVAAGGMYALGLRRLWHAAGVGRGVGRADAWTFVAAWMLLALTLLSPLHALGGVLFSAHMAQHELLMTVAAPMLVLARPLIPFVWALPPPWRRATGLRLTRSWTGRAWHALTHPLAALLLHGVAIWVWHIPALYDATVTSETMHAAQHVSFFATALLFWWVVLRRGEARGGTPASIGVLFATMLHTGALGALLALSPTLAYSAYATTTGPWGLTPIDDQQLGGLIMWVPGGIAYLVAALAVATRMLRESETRARRREDAALTA